uniref:Uncharacterized protein n=1 Tax=Canis lupus dingo TaxID=286419 RepID=A0A8C0L5L2_CANLU
MPSSSIHVVANARLHVALPQAVPSKVDLNHLRHPAHLSRGSALKHTDLPCRATSEDQAGGPANLDCASTGQAYDLDTWARDLQLSLASGKQRVAWTENFVPVFS